VVIFAPVDSEWTSQARELGLEVTHDYEVNKFGAPFFRSIMSKLEENYQGSLYGFVNGDILFGNDVLATVSAVVNAVCERTIGPKVRRLLKLFFPQAIPWKNMTASLLLLDEYDGVDLDDWKAEEQWRGVRLCDAAITFFNHQPDPEAVQVLPERSPGLFLHVQGPL